MELSINYLAVLAAAVAAMVIGFVWYSPQFGFGKVWMRLMGWGEDMPESAKTSAMRGYILNFIAALVMAVVLSHFAYVWGAREVATALELAFWVWLGFVATVLLGSYLWEGKPLTLYVLNVGYHLVTLSIMSLIVSLWV